MKCPFKQFAACVIGMYVDVFQGCNLCECDVAPPPPVALDVPVQCDPMVCTLHCEHGLETDRNGKKLEEYECPPSPPPSPTPPKPVQSTFKHLINICTAYVCLHFIFV